MNVDAVVAAEADLGREVEMPPNPALTQTQQNSGLKDNVEVAKGGEDAPEDHHFKRDWLLMDCIIALLNVPLLFLAITIVKVKNRTKLDLLVAPHEPYHDSFIHPTEQCRPVVPRAVRRETAEDDVFHRECFPRLAQT